MAGPATAPLPSKARFAAPPKLSVGSVNKPVRGPRTEGVKVTCKLQEAPEANEAGHPFELTAKSPVVAGAPRVSTAMPELDTVKVRGELGIPTAWLGKFNWPGPSEITGTLR